MFNTNELLENLTGSLNFNTLRTVLIVIIAFIFISIIAFLVLYIFRTIAIYRLSTNLGIENPKRAFYPIVEYTIMGELADKSSNDDIKTSKTITILKIIEVVFLVLTFLFFLLATIKLPGLINTIMDIVNGNLTSLSLDSLLTQDTISLLIFGGLAFANYGLSTLFNLAFRITYCIILSRIFKAYGIRSCVFLAVISFLIEPVGHIALFAIRNRKPQK